MTCRVGWPGANVLGNVLAGVIKETIAVIADDPVPFNVTLVAVAVNTPVAVSVIEPLTTQLVSFAPFVHR